MADGKQAAPASETTELHVPQTMHIETPPADTTQEPAADKPRSARDSMMARIVERAEEQRQKEKETYREIAKASGDDVPEGPVEEPLPPAEPQAESVAEPTPEPPPIAAAPQQPVRRTILVGNQQLSLTEQEIEHLAGIGAMASIAMQQRPTQQQMQPTQPAQMQRVEPPADPIDSEAARAIAKQILFGDEEAGAKAIQDLAGRLASKLSAPVPQINPEQVASDAAMRAYKQIQHERNLETIGNEYPDIFKDNNLTLVAVNMVGELRQRYTVLGQPKSDLELYREACKETADRYMRPVAPQSGVESPQPPAQAAPQVPAQPDRLERKRAAPRPPAAANRAASAPEASRPPTGSDIVAWMKQKRGQALMQ